MGASEHRAKAAGQGSVPLAIVTVSDTRTPDTDVSGGLIRELVEAAGMDGANSWDIIRFVYLPHLKPSIIVLVLMSTFWTFNNFVYVWLTTGAGPGYYTNVMATDVYIKAFIDGRLGYSSAVGVVMAALMLVFGLVYLRVVARREFREVLK